MARRPVNRLEPRVTMLFAIDAGATRTRIVAEAPSGHLVRLDVGSISRASVDEAASRDRLRETFAVVVQIAAQGDSAGWLASAGVAPETISAELPAIQMVLPKEIRQLAVSNDAIPLLIAPPLTGSGVVVVLGTGSGILGGNGDAIMRLGHHDYLGADRGSAFYVGLLGLRAALRAHDGLGPPSSLATALAEYVGHDVASEARRLAALPFPKPAVARLAVPVLRCWRDHDDVAGAVVTAAVEAIAAGVARMRSALRLTAAAGTIITGGLVIGADDYGVAVRAAIHRACGVHDVTVCTDPDAKTLACAHMLVDVGGRPQVHSAYFGSHVWLLEPT